MKRALWLLAIVLPACAAVLDIKDLVPGAEEDGGNGPDGTSPITEAGPNNPDDAEVDTGTDAPITCTDTTTDDNCGRCGHSCLGGKCVQSVCQSVEIATGGVITGLTIDSTHVYFASYSPNAIARVAKGGGTVDTLASGADVDVPKHLAVSATHVYWGNADCCTTNVSRVPLAGGAVQVLATVEEAISVALDGDYVYWADRNNSVVQRRLNDGGGAIQLVGNGEGAQPMAVAVRDASAFYIGDFSGQVRRANNPPDGGSTAIGANGQSGRELALDDTYVYWSVQIDPGTPGRISRAPRAGGTVSTIGPAGGEPLGIAVDGDTIYWTAQAEPDGGPAGGVYSCKVTGCVGAPTVIASKQDAPRGIAVDAKAIYWGTNGHVMKIAKP